MRKILCPKCNGSMFLREGKFGWFWGCKTFPHCTGSRSIEEVMICPKCFSQMKEKNDIISCKCGYEKHILRYSISTSRSHSFKSKQSGWTDEDWYDYGDSMGFSFYDFGDN